MSDCSAVPGCDFWSFWRPGPQPWPFVHLAMPFTIYYVFHNVWVALTIVFLNEMFECALWGAARSYPGVIFGETQTSSESFGDSMIGDPLTGMLGIALAAYAKFVFDVPALLPASLRSGVWWRNTLAFAAIAVLSGRTGTAFQTAWEEQCARVPPIGAFIFTVSSVGTIGSLWALDMSSEGMRHAVWADRPLADVTRGYAVWGLSMLFMSMFTWCVLMEPYVLVAIAAGTLAVVYTSALVFRSAWVAATAAAAAPAGVAGLRGLHSAQVAVWKEH